MITSNFCNCKTGGWLVQYSRLILLSFLCPCNWKISYHLSQSTQVEAMWDGVELHTLRTRLPPLRDISMNGQTCSWISRFIKFITFQANILNHNFYHVLPSQPTNGSPRQRTVKDWAAAGQPADQSADSNAKHGGVCWQNVKNFSNYFYLNLHFDLLINTRKFHSGDWFFLLFFFLHLHSRARLPVTLWWCRGRPVHWQDNLCSPARTRW